MKHPEHPRLCGTLTRMDPDVVDPAVLEALELTQDLTVTSARLQAYASRLLTPAVAAHRKKIADAHSQRASADTLRNRAAKLSDGPHKIELLDRAERFERRAGVILAGATMPPDLRYPLDSLRLVAKARDALVAAQVALDALDPDEVSDFLASLQVPSEHDRVVGDHPIDVDDPAMLVRNEIGRHVGMLGGYVDDSGNLRLRQFAISVLATSTPGGDRLSLLMPTQGKDASPVRAVPSPTANGPAPVEPSPDAGAAPEPSA